MTDAIRQGLYGPGPVRPADPGTPRTTPEQPAVGFDRLLDDELRRATPGGVRWSAHARTRLTEAGALNAAQAERLYRAIQLAQGKGARASLVLIDGTAFIVDVRNQTVVTAVGPDRQREQVFTQIDSAVIG